MSLSSLLLPMVVLASLVHSCSGQAATYFKGSATQVATGGAAVVVVLVEALEELEKEYVNEFAAKHGAAVGIQTAGNRGVFSTDATPEEMVEQLSSALSAASVLSSDGDMGKYPIVAFGAAANSALKLAVAGWPVVVAVGPSLEGLVLPPKNSTVEEAEKAPILLLIADVEVNGPFVTATEEKLDAAGIHWETMRLGGTSEYFFFDYSPNFNLPVWIRAYDALNGFIGDALLDGGTKGTKDPGGAVPSGVSVESPFMYNDGDTKLEGYLAYPTSAVAEGVLLPGVVVLPDADGLEEYEFARANMLAKMGYVTLGANTYGLPIGESPATSDERSELLSSWRGDPEKYVQRIRAAVNALKGLSYVNVSAIGMTGYCFGGSGVVFDVFSNSDIQVGVSFHGGISTHPNVTTVSPAQPYFTFQSGGADESAEDIAWLQQGLTAMGGDWDITRYSKVLHAFTAWNRADRYHPRADGRSWAAMTARLNEFMPSPVAGNVTGSIHEGNNTDKGDAMSTNDDSASGRSGKRRHLAVAFFLATIMLLT